MAGVNILDLTEATEVNETTDYLAIVDKSDTSQDVTGSTKRATVRKLLGDKALPSGDFVGTTDTQTLTNKTLTSPKLNEDVVVTVKASELNGMLTGWIPAGETWTYASADDPTFTFTISGDKTSKYSAGMRIKLTQTSVKYFIITAVSYVSPNTTITVYGGTDYDLVNATITNPYYSTQKAPQGFPLNPVKWEVKTNLSSGNQQAPTSGTWYNVANNKITVPIGIWNIRFKADFAAVGSGGYLLVGATLSNANNTKWDNDLTVATESSAGITQLGYITLGASKTLTMTSKTNLYLNLMTDSPNTSGIYIRIPASIWAVCAYL